MKRHVLTLMLITAISSMQPACAAVQFEKEKKISYDDKQAADFEKIAQSILGKTYWFEPNPKASDFSQLKFKESLPSAERSSYENHQSPAFRPTEKVAFTVTNVFVYQDPKSSIRSPEYYAEITFEGGKVGYLQIQYSFEPPFKVYDPTKSYHSSYEEVVYLDDPDVVREREKAEAAAAERKRVADQKAWEARGGVRIGMTKKQVLASNWGEPDDVNTTSTRNGTFEQWVYEDGNYLYFTNGRLTGIQN